jgi:hypothetical protein
VTDGVKAALRMGGTLLYLSTRADVIIIEFREWADEIAADPTTFGLNAPFGAPLHFGTGTPELDFSTGAPVPFYPENPRAADRPLDPIAFIDFVHPKAATHGVLGSFVSASLPINVRLFEDGNNFAYGGCGGPGRSGSLHRWTRLWHLVPRAIR